VPSGAQHSHAAKRHAGEADEAADGSKDSSRHEKSPVDLDPGLGCAAAIRHLFRIWRAARRAITRRG
jgi:hypothetical protein